MYIFAVVAFMFVLPIVSVIVELTVNQNYTSVVDVVAKWFVFWAIGVRLFTAGLRQIIKPGLTAEGILGIKDKASWQLVRELGFANTAIGLASIISLWATDWRLACALIGGLFILLAGLEHVRKKQRNGEEMLAMISDLFIGVIGIGLVVVSAL